MYNDDCIGFVPFKSTKRKKFQNSEIGAPAP